MMAAARMPKRREERQRRARVRTAQTRKTESLGRETTQSLESLHSITFEDFSHKNSLVNKEPKLIFWPILVILAKSRN